MKRFFAFLHVLALTLPLFACSSAIPDEKTEEPAAPAETRPQTEEKTKEEIPVRSVKAPLTERPNYVLSENASSDEIRAMAVKAMRDMLTVVWYPDRTIEYEFETYSGDYKSFKLPQNETYAGVPYTNGITGLFQFLEYYDPATGRVSCQNGEAFDLTIGGQCSGCVIWGVTTVASSLFYRGRWQRRADGYLPVGDITLDTGSQTVCAFNGKEKMFAAYAEMKPADWFVSTDHVMMAIEDAHVVRNADGSINGAESYVMIQDQQGGQRNSSATYVVTEDGERRHYSGRLSVKQTFEALFDKSYYPLTCAEFQGLKPYTMPSVTADREIVSLDDFNAAKIDSVYNIAVLRVNVFDEEGSVYARSVTTVHADMIAERIKSYPLERLKLNANTLKRNVSRTGDFTVTLTVIDATGSEFPVASFETTI